MDQVCTVKDLTKAMGSRRKGRVVAFQALYAWGLNRTQIDAILDFPWLDQEHRTRYGEETLTFARMLVSGTLEHIEGIDESITRQLEHWDFSRVAKVDLALLRMSVYALTHQKDIPASVTIDEAIEIAKEYGGRESYRFVNGVLDGIRRGMASKH